MTQTCVRIRPGTNHAITVDFPARRQGEETSSSKNRTDASLHLAHQKLAIYLLASGSAKRRNIKNSPSQISWRRTSAGCAKSTSRNQSGKPSQPTAPSSLLTSAYCGPYMNGARVLRVTAELLQHLVAPVQCKKGCPSRGVEWRCPLAR